MKQLLSFLILASTFNAFASADLYNALNVEEVSTTELATCQKTVKSLGGLKCTKSRCAVNSDDGNVFFKNSYKCILSLSQINQQDIYEALDVEEKSLPANRMTLKTVKQVDQLSCTKTDVIHRAPKFSCELQAKRPTYQIKCDPDRYGLSNKKCFTSFQR